MKTCASAVKFHLNDETTIEDCWNCDDDGEVGYQLMADDEIIGHWNKTSESKRWWLWRWSSIVRETILSFLTISFAE